MISLFTASRQLLWIVVLAILVGKKAAVAYVTIVVELDPIFSATPVACSSNFIADLNGNLTTWILDATGSISLLSDVSIPGGVHLSYFNNVGRRRTRSLSAQTGWNKCTSGGCAVNTGIGICKLCGGARRRRGLQGTTNSPASRSTASIDWSKVGTDVTSAVAPLLIAFASQNQDAAAGCLGDPTLLSVTVTFLTNVPMDADMEATLVAAFRTSTPHGPPKCLARRAECTSDVLSCCPGTQCLGDQFQKFCVHV